ncbi:MAG: HD domain-containing protein [Cyclobacteriaceae bacterium]|nr:HD domain-containing protein [Cyclobacteriaceae bacterium]
MKGSSKLIKQVKSCVKAFYKCRQGEANKYHNIDHTISVVKVAKKIARQVKLKEQDRAILLIAAWFHDIGYLTNSKEAHHISARKAIAFLTFIDADSAIIEGVDKAILAAAVPQHPTTLVEQILCDADLYTYLGSKDFRKQTEKLRLETEELTGNKISKKTWHRNELEFMEGHYFFTTYAHSKRGKIKEENLKWLKQVTQEENIAA